MDMSNGILKGYDYPTSWALNPANYQNMDNDGVDWAALAQQWIKMKETVVPPAPPPPSIIGFSTTSLSDVTNMPIDLDLKDDGVPPAPPAPNISGSDSWNQWNQWQSHWNQNAAGTAIGTWEWNNLSNESNGKSVEISKIINTAVVPPPAPAISSSNAAFVNHCTPNTAVQPVSPIASSFGYTPMSHYSNQVSTIDFWNNEHHQQAAVSETIPPAQSSSFIKAMHTSSNRIPISSLPLSVHSNTDIAAVRNRDLREKTSDDELSSTLDAVKRKQLPAWIREGLEKMEREKQKAVERERQEIFRKQELEARKKIEDQARAVLNPSKSKFDSDSEKEATERECDDEKNISPYDKNNKKSERDSCERESPDTSRPRRTRFRNVSSPEAMSQVIADTKNEKSPDAAPSVAPVLLFNKEEALQNMMLKVRRSLTEILLEVTNDEINNVCKEVWKRSCDRGGNSSGSPYKTAPISQITRKLGLGIYGDSNSESEDEHSPHHENSQDTTGEVDSDEELKETLRRRQQAFRKTEAEIEFLLAEEEEEQTEVKKRAKNKYSEEVENRNKETIRQKETVRDCERDMKEKKVEIGKRLTDSNERRSTSSCSIKKSHINERSSSTNSKLTAKDMDSSKIAIDQEDRSSSSDSVSQCDSSKRTAHSNFSSNRDENHLSLKKATRLHNKDEKNHSSSRSRSRSRNEHSSRENSSESTKSVSKIDKNTTSFDDTMRGSGFSNRKYKTDSHRSVNKQHYRSRTRSVSRSKSRFSSRSRSRSDSRSSSASRSKYRNSRSRSRSNSRRKRRSRDRGSRTDSRSRSRSRSRSIKRSRVINTHKNPSVSSHKRRDTRSRSSERTRRSVSVNRSSKSHRRRRHHYRRDRDRKRSTHRYKD